MHCTILCTGILVGLLAWYIANPQSVRLYETKSSEYLTFAVTPDIHIALDNSSSIAVTHNYPMQMELLKGNVYCDFKKNSVDKPQIKAGEIFVENIGARFSIQMHKDGSNSVSVAEGQVMIHAASGDYLISSLEQVEFDGQTIGKHRMISKQEFAPWLAKQTTQ